MGQRLLMLMPSFPLSGIYVVPVLSPSERVEEKDHDPSSLPASGVAQVSLNFHSLGSNRFRQRSSSCASGSVVLLAQTAVSGRAE